MVITKWTKVVSPNPFAGYINQVVVYNNKIYTGTNSIAGGGALFEWDGIGSNWVRVSQYLGNNESVWSLVVYNNKLYIGTYGTLGERLLEWDDIDTLTKVASNPTGGGSTVYCLVVYNNKIYAGTNGRLLKWNGTDAWVVVAPALNSQTIIYSLAVYNNKLYGGTYGGGRLFQWNDSNAWVQVAPQLNSQSRIQSLVVYNNKLYGGTSGNGYLFEWNGTDAWVRVATQLNSQTKITSMVVFESKLYGATSTGGILFEWNDVDSWIQVAPQLNVGNYILSLCVYNGNIYGCSFVDSLLQRADPDTPTGITYRLSAYDSMPFSDSIFRTIRPNKNESIPLSDSIFRTIRPNKNESLSLLDTLIRNIRTFISDPLSLLDVLRNSMTHYIELSDSMPFSDSLIRTTHQYKSESFILLDNIKRWLGIYRFDVIDLNDILNTGFFRNVSLSDSLVLSDSAIKRLFINKTDTMEIVDAISYCKEYVLGIIRYINAHDTMSLTDGFDGYITDNEGEQQHVSSSAINKVIKLYKADDMVIADFILELCVYSPLIRHMVFGDNLILSDSLVKSVRLHTYSEHLSIIDKIKSFILHKDTADSVVISDLLSRLVESLKSDNLILTDDTIIGYIKSKLLSDSIALTDARTFNFIRTVVDVLSLADAINRRDITKALDTPLSLVDSLSKEASIHLADVEDIDDVHTLIKKIYKFPSDSMPFADAIIKEVQPHIHDNLSLFDRICYQISRIGWGVGTETLLLLDSLRKRIGLYRFESIDIYETMNRLFHGLRSDSITLSDSILFKNFTKLNRDQILILDDLSRLLSMRPFSDNMDLLDRLRRLFPLFISDSVPITDSAIHALVKNLSDIIVPQDTIVQKVVKKVVQTPVALMDALQKQVHKLLHSDEEVVDTPEIDLFKAAPTPIPRKEPVPKTPQDEEWHDITSIQRKGPIKRK